MLVDRANVADGYELIVVGAGPAGLTLAKKIEQAAAANRTAGRRGVLLIESGAEAGALNREAQALSNVETSGVFGPDYYQLHSQRGLGGTSRVWNGWCCVLERRSFERGEWPIRYEEIGAYYPEAARILQLPSAVHERPEAPLGTSGAVVYRPYYFAPKPVRFAASHGDWVRRSRHVDVLFNHTVAGVEIRSGAAVAVSVRESVRGPLGGAGKAIRLSADRVVLAAGAVQNARLLLLSLPEGRPPVGAYFCDHPHVFDFADATLDREVMEEAGWGRNDRAAQLGIALSSAYANEHGLMSATLGPPRRSAPNTLFTTELLGRRVAAVQAKLTTRAEMPGLRENRVTLADDADFLGQPRAHVAFDMDVDATVAATNLLNEELVRSGIGRLRLRPRDVWRFEGGGHLMGTTRMGDDPATSVTDANGCVHGLSNLYVAGSSLFPSVGSANPTLTIVALALRLADHLTRASGRT